MSAPIAEPQRGRGVYLLPNVLTTGCLFSGFYAIVAAIDGNFDRAGLAIFAAMLFDGLDGRVARWTGTESAFGKEYDSLADMVAFGLAPAIVTYQWGVERIAEYGRAWGRFGWVVTFFFAVAAALRLARFNTRSAQDKRYFEGLPSPSAAALVASFVWFQNTWRITTGLTELILAFCITAAAGALMVSSVPYPSLKQVDVDQRVRYYYFIMVPLFLALIALDPPTMLLAMFTTFVFSAPLLWVLRKLRRVGRGPDTPAA